MTSLATLQLGLVPGITIRSIDGLMEQLGSAENIIGASASQLQQAGLSLKATDALKNPDTEQVKKCLKWAEQPERHIIAWTDDRYPCLLRETASSPPLLFIHGDPDLPAMPQLAIVGSRNATPGGLDTARRFAAHLARAGFCITSGLALGIDTSAHDAALNSGGKTIAVFGSGPDIIYPRENQMLAARIAENGALLSEFSPGTSPLRSRFPRRNRIISGLSVGTLVIEAGLRSGALITARNAAEQGREVFAVPGSIHNPVAKGCHQLIRSGAKLVETSDDVMEELGAMITSIAAGIKQNPETAALQKTPTISEDHQSLLEVMGWDPVHIDTLVKRSGLTTEEVSSMLLILALEGRVEPLTGGRYTQREEGSA